MLNSSEISVVVQGAVDDSAVTARCLAGIRQLLPDAQLILSTWEGTDVSGLVFDEVVFSKDPGGVLADERHHVFNNVNRQIVSTKAGLLCAKRRLTLKFRTDLLLLSADFLRFFGRYDGVRIRTQDFIFKNRVLICNFYTRNPGAWAIPFHPSDWVMFGNTVDVWDYFDVPLMPEEEMRWFLERPKNTGLFAEYLSRYTPEQYICLSFLKKHWTVDCSYYADIDGNREATERLFAGNFVVLDYGRQMKIVFTKYNPNRYREKCTLVSHRLWKKMFRFYTLGEKRYARVFRRREAFSHRLRGAAVRVLDWVHLKEPLKKWMEKRYD